jgi:hypothetical protein
MALLHSLVDDLMIQNRCHQRKGVTLRSQHLNITRLEVVALWVWESTLNYSRTL